jgi:hypothetical protein
LRDDIITALSIQFSPYPAVNIDYLTVFFNATHPSCQHYFKGAIASPWRSTNV